MPRNDTSVYDYIFFSRQLRALVIIIAYGITLSVGLLAVPDSCLYFKSILLLQHGRTKSFSSQKVVKALLKQ